MLKGWFKVYRKLSESPSWRALSASGKAVFMTILLNANYRESTALICGDRYTIKPGEWLTSIATIQNLAGRGVSEKNVRTALSILERDGFLTKRRAKGNQTILSVNNWFLYQSDNREAKQRAKVGRSNGNENGEANGRAITEGDFCVSGEANGKAKVEKRAESKEVKELKEKDIVPHHAEHESGLGKIESALTALKSNREKYLKLYPRVILDEIEIEFRRWADVRKSRVNEIKDWNRFWHRWLKTENEKAVYRQSKNPTLPVSMYKELD